MAIYHFEGNIISRSQGRSSVAASAYRSCSELVDEHTGVIHDFEKKSPDLIYSEILLPENAPDWMLNRQQLWNHVEEVEKRKDAQLARDFNIALPRELSEKQNIDLAHEFVQKEFVARGMVADLCLHRGHKGGEDQPHAHVILSLREVGPDGFLGKERSWNDKNLMLHWRQAWAEFCNRHLAMHGHDMRVDHRTLEAQGINLEPQSKIGPNVCKEQMARFEEHQRLAKRNGERILKNPTIALDAITKQQSTFTRQDLARFINRHTENDEQFRTVYEVVKASPEIVELGEDSKGNVRYSTKSMIQLESEMIDKATQLSNQETHKVGFASNAFALEGKSLSKEQHHAFNHVIESNNIACVVGYAGTGKSYMLGVAKDAWEEQGYRVKGMALSGIAAENLESGSGIKSHTIANRLLTWGHQRELLTAKDIVVIDEAGMVGSRQMNALLQEISRANAKAVLVGDAEQLQAIDAGAAFRAITERVGFCEMTEVRRQVEPWQQDATRYLAKGMTKYGIDAYSWYGHVHEHKSQESAMNAMTEIWQEMRSNEPYKSQIILAYTRKEVRELNERARELRKANGELGEDVEVVTARGKRQFAEKDRVYFLRNEKSLGVKNGTLGTIESVKNHCFTIKLDSHSEEKERQVKFHIKDYDDIDHGYAATVHKAQGITVDRSLVLASKYFDRHTAYVALSRHRDNAELYWSKEQFKNEPSMIKSLSRERAKDITLDYRDARGLSELEVDVNSRSWQRRFEKEVKELEQKIDRPISYKLKDGDRGRYCGVAKLAGHKFGVMEKEGGQVKLVHLQQDPQLKKGEVFSLSISDAEHGGRAMQINNHSKGLEIDREIEI